MSDPAELGAIFHIAIRATHGDVRSEREVVRRIVDMGVAAYRDRILAYLITTQFIRDLAKMERAKEALWRIKRIEAKLQGKPLPPDLE